MKLGKSVKYLKRTKMKRLVESLAPIYLGFALLTFANIDWNQWEFYAITVPFCILDAISDFNKSE
jgi:1,4-dihydroxy-2-naphthoate octaprenyltransferase